MSTEEANTIYHTVNLGSLWSFGPILGAASMAIFVYVICACVTWFNRYRGLSSGLRCNTQVLQNWLLTLATSPDHCTLVSTFIIYVSVNLSGSLLQQIQH